MSGLLFVAHDLGGARVLVPVIEHYRAARGRVAVFARGPAREVLKDEGYGTGAEIGKQDSEDIAEVFASVQPDAVVTGTSERATLERDAWETARARNIRSIALLDASINLDKRFGKSRPDAIGVVDEAARLELEELTGGSTRIEVVGQPHLEWIAALVGRDSKPGVPGRRFVYFSEPIVEAPGNRHPVGYDQFSVAERVLASLDGCESLQLQIKPHPNEAPQRWHDWRARVDLPEGLSLEITTCDAFSLMRSADGVLGLGSMALLEAVLVGLPVLALQPGRTYCPNPRLDSDPAITLVTDPEAVADSIRAFITEVVTGNSGRTIHTSSFDGSTACAMNLIENTMTAGAAASALETKI